MGTRPHLGLLARATGAAVLTGALALQAGAATPHATQRFVVAHAYAASAALPGALTCVGRSFCIELAFPAHSFFAPAEVLVTHDAGATWRDESTVPALAGGFDYGAQIVCESTTTCFAGAGGLGLAVSRDAGRHWSLHRGLRSGWALGRNVACLADGACVGVGRTGSHLVTEYLAPGARAFAVLPATLPAGFAPTALACASVRRCTLEGAEGRTDGDVLTSGPVDRSLHWTVGPTTRGWVVRALACPSAAICFSLRDKDRVVHRGKRVRLVLQEELVARSTDAGLSWRSVARPSGRRLPSSLACGSIAVCGTAIGQSGSNGGTVTIEVGISVQVKGVVASRSDRPRVDAGSVPAMTTTDGGRRWRTHAVAPAIAGGTMSGATACLADGRCLADAADAGAGGGRTERLDPTGGTTLLDTQTDAVGASSVVCTLGSTCLRVDEFDGLHGYDADLRVSHDDGTTWAPMPLPRGAEPVLVAGCQDQDTCEVVAVTGVRLVGGEVGVYDYRSSTVELLDTTDGGATWTASSIGTNEIPSAASCSDPLQCVVLVQVGSTGESLPEYLASTQDGGHTWSTTPVEPPFGLFFFPFENGSPVLSCAGTGTCLFAEPAVASGASTLLRSSDGGATWIVTTPPGPRGDDVEAVSCTAESTCDVVFASQQGGRSYLVQSVAFGTTWTPPLAVRGSGSSSVEAMACSTGSDCTAVLASVLTEAESTSDLGVTWSAIGWPGSGAPLVGFTSIGAMSCTASTCMLVESSLQFPVFNVLGAAPKASTELLRLTG